MTNELSCPQADVLARLLEGGLPPHTAERLASHLENCDRCAAAVDRLHGPSRLADAARQAHTSAALEEDTFVEQLIERASLSREASHEAELPEDCLGFLAPTERDDELGRLGHYRVLEVLGSGGMGIVFRAEDVQLRRQVALKLIRPLLVTNPLVRQRFLREAQAAAAIDDERIVTVHQVGEDRGFPYIAMQLLQGRSLQDRLREQAATGKSPLPLDETLRIGHEIALGLGAAHRQGLIHRDIKPGNVWLESAVTNDATASSSEDLLRRVKLLDFGLARELSRDVSLTQAGQLAGTPAYLAPEQVRGADVDPRCDLFSLGCVLYEMATGRSPFAANDSIATLHAICHTEPASPQLENAKIPQPLAELILQLLAKDPARRPASADEVAHRLQAICGGCQGTEPQGRVFGDPRLPVPSSVVRQRVLLRLVVASAVLGLLAAAAIFTIPSEKGVLVIETSDPAIALQLNAAGGVTLRDTRTLREFRLSVGQHKLPTGQYELVVEDAAIGLRFSEDQFFMSDGQVIRLTARVEGSSDEPLTSWLHDVERLTGSQKLNAVVRKLQELNPEFDGLVETRTLDGSIVELKLVTDHVTDLSPLSALPGVQKLECAGSAEGLGRLQDLAPLRTLASLMLLDCSNNQIVSLLPLQGLPLQQLRCGGNPLEDVSPLRQLPLESLALDRTLVSDLSSLRSVPLKQLDLRASQVHELWTVEELKSLRMLDCDFRPHRDATSLRFIATLRTLNGKPVETFWRDHDARQQALAEWLLAARELTDQQKVEAVSKMLQQLNPGFDGFLIPSFTEGKLTVLQLFTDEVTDIEPLRVLTNLERLIIRGSVRRSGKLFDLEPIGELPIVYLECGFNELSDLSPLAGSGLRVLLCRGTRVRDLSPLSNIPVFYLELGATPVSDISPLRGRTITNLYLRDTRIRDYSPLVEIPIHVLAADLDPLRDRALLQKIRTLETFNDMPVAELWK